MTLQDLTNNRDRIIKKIQWQMSGDAAARKMMVKPIMTKMVAMLGREDIAEMKPTMKNIDKFTDMATASWIKYSYNPMETMTRQEWNDFYDRREAAKRGSHSTFYYIM